MRGAAPQGAGQGLQAGRVHGNPAPACAVPLVLSARRPFGSPCANAWLAPGPAPAEDAPKLNSLTYMNRISNERWSPEDTELFYKASQPEGARPACCPPGALPFNSSTPTYRTA